MAASTLGSVDIWGLHGSRRSKDSIRGEKLTSCRRSAQQTGVFAPVAVATRLPAPTFAERSNSNCCERCVCMLIVAVIVANDSTADRLNLPRQRECVRFLLAEAPRTV
jgi:hypothetical protein